MSNIGGTSSSLDWPGKLRAALDTYFSEEDLEALCFDMRIDYEDLPGQSKPKKVVELISLVSREGRLVELIDLCGRYRPNVPWDELREAARRDPLVFHSYAPGSPTPSQLESGPHAVRQGVPIWMLIVFGVVAVVASVIVVVLLVLPPREGPDEEVVLAQESTPMPAGDPEVPTTPTPADLPAEAAEAPPPPEAVEATETPTATSSPTRTPTATSSPTQTPSITPSRTPTSLADGPSQTIYVEQPSFPGDCGARPSGSVCLVYGDDFVWLIYDSIRARDVVGTFQGNAVAVARGGDADYYHVLNTNLVRGVPTDPSRAGYIEQPSFPGDCGARPSGSVCLVYGDDFVWLIYDSIRARDVAGTFQGNEVAVARGGDADYYHVLNTNLVKAMP